MHCRSAITHILLDLDPYIFSWILIHSPHKQVCALCDSFPAADISHLIYLWKMDRAYAKTNHWSVGCLEELLVQFIEQYSSCKKPVSGFISTMRWEKEAFLFSRDLKKLFTSCSIEATCQLIYPAEWYLF